MADDLAGVVATAIAGWGADHVAVGVQRAEGPPVLVGDDGRRFALASITKLFTALAVLVAVEEGAIALDDPAGPEGATVRHLLAHASGLGFDRRQPLDRPGRRRIYSNTGYEVLGEALTAATGIDVSTYATEAVVEPLGLGGTRAAGSPAAGWSATAADVVALLEQVRRPTLVAPETMALATSVAFPGLAGVLPDLGRFDPLDWGLGFEVRDGKSPHWTGTANGPRTVGHFGGAGTFAWHDPDAGLTLVALSDRRFGRWALEAWPQLSDQVLTTAGARPTK